MVPVIVKRLHDAFKKTAEDPAAQALFKKFHIDHRFASDADFKKALEATCAQFTPVIEQLSLPAK